MLAITVLDLHASLRVEVEPRPSDFDRWFDCRIYVDAFPFSGTLSTIFTEEDLVDFAAALDHASMTGQAVLGGGRAAELRLEMVSSSAGGGTLNVECSVTPSGDDPNPLLRFIVFDVEPFAEAVAHHVRAVATISPWPRP